MNTAKSLANDDSQVRQTRPKTHDAGLSVEQFEVAETVEVVDARLGVLLDAWPHAGECANPERVPFGADPSKVISLENTRPRRLRHEPHHTRFLCTMGVRWITLGEGGLETEWLALPSVLLSGWLSSWEENGDGHVCAKLRVAIGPFVLARPGHLGAPRRAGRVPPQHLVHLYRRPFLSDGRMLPGGVPLGADSEH